MGPINEVPEQETARRGLARARRAHAPPGVHLPSPAHAYRAGGHLDLQGPSRAAAPRVVPGCRVPSPSRFGTCRIPFFARRRSFLEIGSAEPIFKFFVFCRSRQALSNESLVVAICADTAGERTVQNGVKS